MKSIKQFNFASIKSVIKQIRTFNTITMANPIPNIKLNNGARFPVLGLGTSSGLPGKEAEVGQAIKYAIDLGYRHFDCAHIYGNEHIIGEALAEKIAEGVVKREELYIVSKLWNTFHRPDLVEPAIRNTLKDLKLDYLDQYLMHWPHSFKEDDGVFPIDTKTGLNIPGYQDYVETWKAMEELQRKGLTKSIGVSNFNSQQIEKLLKSASIVPVTNQIECHPYLNQKKLRQFCAARGIAITAYCPLGSPSRPWKKQGDPDVLSDENIKEIAGNYNKSPAQILLRYNVDLGNAVIPKSSNKKRLAENLDIFDFSLSIEDIAFINTFDCNGRICPCAEARELPDYPFKEGIEY